MTLYEKIKEMPLEEMGEFLDKITINGIKCGRSDNCDVCEVEECTLPSYRVMLTWEYQVKH